MNRPTIALLCLLIGLVSSSNAAVLFEVSHRTQNVNFVAEPYRVARSTEIDYRYDQYVENTGNRYAATVFARAETGELGIYHRTVKAIAIAAPVRNLERRVMCVPLLG